MTDAHAPEWITGQTDKTVRSILYVCWIATLNTAEHHMGLGLAQTQVRCILFACHDGRNAHLRDEIDGLVGRVVVNMERYQCRHYVPGRSLANSSQVLAVYRAEQLARLRDPMTTYTCPGIAMPQPPDAPYPGLVACYRAGHQCPPKEPTTTYPNGYRTTTWRCPCCGDFGPSFSHPFPDGDFYEQETP